MGRDILLGGAGLDGEPVRRRRLIAHELAHVVQSKRGGAPAGVAELEDEAQRAGEDAAVGRAPSLKLSAPAGRPLRAPPGLAPGLDIGWKAPELTQTWYTLDDFDTGESVLKRSHLERIDAVVKDLARDPLMGGFITVVGYADAIGPNPANRVLGQQRADAVWSALVGEGVSPDDVRAWSLGEEILEVGTRKAEARNRRVEIFVRRKRMRFGLAPTAPAPRIGGAGRAKEATHGEPIPSTLRSEAEQAEDRRREFERRIAELAEDKGAKQGTLFDEAVTYLAEKGIETGLKEALKAILTAIAGPASERPASETGPPVFEQHKPTIIAVPFPFPGDQPRPANVHNPTLNVADKLSANITKTTYKRGEFITFRFTTPESYGQVSAVVEIVPAAGGAAVRSLAITGRRSGCETLEVPGTAGLYVLQVRLVDEDPHPNGMRRFSVRELDPAERR